jgi:hypothetical protein
VRKVPARARSIRSFSHDRSLKDRGISVLPAENPRGTPIFKDLVEDPPTSEDEFRGLWKLYFVCLIAGHLRQTGIAQFPAPQVIQKLEEAGLLPREWNLRSLLRLSLDYVRSVLKAESVEGGIKIDPATQLPVGISGKITLREPGANALGSGLLSADDLLSQLDQALGNVSQKVWLVLDRLDVAFAETTALEANALRAVFRVYLDMLALLYTTSPSEMTEFVLFVSRIVFSSPAAMLSWRRSRELHRSSTHCVTTSLATLLSSR